MQAVLSSFSLPTCPQLLLSLGRPILGLSTVMNTQSILWMTGFTPLMSLPSSLLSTWNVLQLSCAVWKCPLIFQDQGQTSSRPRKLVLQQQKPAGCTLLLPLHLCHSQAGKAHLSLLEQGSHVSSFGSTSTALQRVWQKRNSKYLIRKQAEKTLGYHFTSRRLANVRKLDNCWCGYE